MKVFDIMKLKLASRYLDSVLDTGLTKVPSKLSNTGGMSDE